jgi:hypothetical protein
MNRWVVWSYKWKEGKWNKVPQKANGGGNLSWKDPNGWLSYDRAVSLASSQPSKFDGIGIIINGAGLAGIDLDHCIINGQIKPWVRALLDCAETYAEISPSGEGIRTIALDGGQNYKTIAKSERGIELYTTGRFLTITGDHISGTPHDICVAPRTVSAVEVLGTSEHVPVVMEGNGTHEAGLRLVGQLVRCIDDDEFIERLVTALFPPNYKNGGGNSLEEIPSWIKSARKKLESGEWEEPQGKGKKKSQAEELLQVAGGLQLFHSRDYVAYVDLTKDNHRETWPVKSTGFRRWLINQYLTSKGRGPSDESLRTTINTYDAAANCTGEQREVFTRVGEHEGKHYIDLCDDKWRAIELDEDGWRVINSPRVRFVRSPRMRPLPVPVKGGSLEQLRSVLHIEDDDFKKAVGWLLGAMRKSSNYPGMAVTGEEGSAKTTTLRMLLALIDPCHPGLLSFPKDERDLSISAKGRHVLGYDNISNIYPAMADCLCRIATGSGLETRTLHTDDETTAFDIVRPFALNGITEVVKRADLLDRTITIRLQPISYEERREEAEVWKVFDTARPQIIGVLLDAMAHGLKALPTTKLARAPRMADFTKWVVACEPALWEAGAFERIMDDNKVAAAITAIESNNVMLCLLRAIKDRDNRKWIGNAASLLELLNATAIEQDTRRRDWPKNPSHLSGQLTRNVQSLATVGVSVERGRASGDRRDRFLTISAAGGGIWEDLIEGRKQSGPPY